MGTAVAESDLGQTKMPREPLNLISRSRTEERRLQRTSDMDKTFRSRASVEKPLTVGAVRTKVRSDG